MEKPWRDAIRWAANQVDPETKRKMIQNVAVAIVKAAAKGDTAAAREMGDRLDGKPDGSVSVNHSGDLTVTHFGLPETSSFIGEALGERPEGPPPKPLPN